MVSAYLLPNDYTKYGYLSISGDGYSASIGFNNNNTIASTKALAVEQFSREQAGSYSSGFALAPQNAILNFTISGLTATTEVTAILKESSTTLVSGSVTTDGSGNATFAVGVVNGKDLNNLSLTVGGNAITLVSGSKTLEAGHIYNINRSAAPVSLIVNPAVGQVIGNNGKNYADATAASADGATAVAVICYVGDAGTADANSTTYKGLALALSDANDGDKAGWSNVSANCLATQYGYMDDPTADMAGIANTDVLVGDGHTHAAASAARNYNSGTHPTGTSEWFLPSAGQWQKMITAAGSYETLVFNVNLKSTTDPYWSSTEYGDGGAWTFAYGNWDYYGGTSLNVRACLAF